MASTADTVGLRLVPAVEMSVLDPAATDLNICGYGIGRDDGPVAIVLEDSREDRRRRIDDMAGLLRELGWLVDEGLLEPRRSEGSPIGRPHLAQAVVAHAGNARRLSREGLTDPSDFLVAYLIVGK